MMAQSASFIVLVTALLISTLSYCSAENVYCVTPTATSCSSCPHNSTHCATLTEYAQEAVSYFTSDTTMVFLPGDHVLDRNITVANVTRLTVCGDSSGNMATVVRNGSVGFSFTNMVDFNIYSLDFTSCNKSWSYDSHSASNSALLLQSTQNAKLVNCSFHDNLGTALTVHNTNITQAENSKFIHNQCASESVRCKLGCGITALNSNLTFIGNTSFLSNKLGASDAGAGAILAVASSLHFTGTGTFCDNFHNSGDKVGVGGAIHITNNTVLAFHGTNNFINNSADNGGGAIYASDITVLTFNGTNNFIGNHVNNGNGGAIRTLHNVLLTFNGTSKFSGNLAMFGGAINAELNILVAFIGTSDFSNNSAGVSGGAIFIANNAVLTFNGTYKFISNSAKYRGGALYSGFNILLSFTGNSSFSSNSALRGGAIFADESPMKFDGNISFTNNGYNTGDSRGGAIYLYISSSLTIMPNTTVCWENNRANLGGAIYVYNANPHIYCTRYKTEKKCFFQLPGQNLSNGLDVQFVFKNNFADTAGSILYGGAIDNCKLTGLNSIDVFDMFVQYQGDNKPSTISSDPFRICPCQNNLPDCSESNITLSLYPGETHYQVSVVAVGQRNGIVPANVTSVDKCILPCSQYIQRTSKTCTTLNYTVDPQQSVSLELYADGPCSMFGNKLVLKLNGAQSCPDSLENSSMSCICIQAFQKYGINPCSTTNGLVQIKRDPNETFWVGYNHYEPGLIVHPYCPFDYCVNEKVLFSLINTDMQCAHNRSGLLCGQCKEGYSLELGTFQCRECNNDNLALLVLFALMGVALVFLLLVCKLTVATGTLGGLVFYANILGDNRTIFLPVRSTDVFLPQELTNTLHIFIAWINLDFGIETCFYNGMDAYSLYHLPRIPNIQQNGVAA